MTEEPTFETYFMVIVNKDGTLATFSDLPDEAPPVERKASNYDVYRAAKDIVEEFEATVLAQRVAQVVISKLNPPTPSVSDKVKEALNDRGLSPEGN
jgi:hypothetical protein